MLWIAGCYRLSQPLYDFGGDFLLLLLFSQELVALKIVLYNN